MTPTTPNAGFYGSPSRRPAGPVPPPAPVSPTPTGGGFYGGRDGGLAAPAPVNRFHATPGKPYVDAPRGIWVGHLESEKAPLDSPWRAAR